MIERTPKIVKSRLSQTVEKDGVTVEVWIIRLEDEAEWLLEVVNSDNTSRIWQDLFASDDEAFAEFERMVAREGMQSFLAQGNGLPLFEGAVDKDGLRMFLDHGDSIPFPGGTIVEEGMRSLLEQYDGILFRQ